MLCSKNGHIKQEFVCVTYYLPANPVVSVVKGVPFSLKQFSEQSPQIFIVGLFKEIQPSHISQVGGHLLWINQKKNGLTFNKDHIILILQWDNLSKHYILVKSQPIAVWSFSSFTAWSTSILHPASMYLGSSHRGPQWECFVLCLRSSGIVLSTCRPAGESKQKDIWTNSDV